MDLRQLAAFNAVAQTRSFSAAADCLNLTQSTISSTIQSLEREWGLSLFHRTSHRVELTAEARTLLPMAQTNLAQARALSEAVHAVHGALRGELRVGIMHTAQNVDGFSIAGDIAAFAQRHPGVAIRLKQASSSDQLAAVAQGDVDLAYVAATGLPHPGVTLTDLVSVEMQLVCHTADPFAQRRRITLAELIDAPFAEFPVGWGVRAVNDLAFSTQGLHRTIAFEMNDGGTLMDFVRSRLAVAVLPPFPLPAGDPLVWRRLESGAPRFTRSLATPAARPAGAVANAFVDLVRHRSGTPAEREIPAHAGGAK